MACTITNFKDIVKVEFFSHDKMTFNKPFSLFDPTVHLVDSTTDVTNDPSVYKPGFCVIASDTLPDFYATIDEMSGNLSVEQSTSVAGSKAKCVLTYNMEWMDSTVGKDSFRAQMVNLSRHAYHIRITYITGAQHIIRSDHDGDGWLCQYKENDGTISMTVQVENTSGAQRVLPPL